MSKNTDIFAITGKLNDYDKKILHKCISDHVEYILEDMGLEYGKYHINFGTVKFYINELRELTNNNKEPMVNKLFEECVYNIERSYLLQQDLDNEEEKLKKELINTQDTELYDKLNKKYKDHLSYIKNKKDSISLTNLQICGVDDYHDELNYKIIKDLSLCHIFIFIKNVISIYQ